MLSMALATPWLPFLPLTAGQILLNNFLSDLPALALAADRVDSAAIRRARRWKVQQVRRFMWTFGLLSSLFDLLTFALLLWVFATPQPLFHAAWFLVSLLTEVGMLLLLRTREPLWRNRPGPWLAAMSALVVALALALVTVPALAHPLGFDPLPWPLLCTVLGVVGACLVVTEAAKRRLLARNRTRPVLRRMKRMARCGIRFHRPHRPHRSDWSDRSDEPRHAMGHRIDSQAASGGRP